MRSEQTMLALIVDTANYDERIRAVMLSGSRANPNARRDPFQDYDITYFVREIESFLADPAWIDHFGELMILQMPEAMEDPPPMNDGHFAYLMQFMDGNRIDLTLFPLTKLSEYETESLSIILLDKDGILPPLPPPSEQDYLPTPPTAKAFADCCNEFWWVSTYVAKGLWRGELLYAKTLMDQALREQLMKMLTWYVGLQNGFARSAGKMGKHFKARLAPELWAMVKQTYADADIAHTWDALLTMGDLFRKLAIPIAQQFGFDYPQRDDQRVSAHLRHVRTLPADAIAIY